MPIRVASVRELKTKQMNVKTKYKKIKTHQNEWTKYTPTIVEHGIVEHHSIEDRDREQGNDKEYKKNMKRRRKKKTHN